MHAWGEDSPFDLCFCIFSHWNNILWEVKNKSTFKFWTAFLSEGSDSGCGPTVFYTVVMSKNVLLPFSKENTI